MIDPLPDRPCMHPDRGYDLRKTPTLLKILGFDDEIAVKGVPPPIQVVSAPFRVTVCGAV